MNRSAMLSEEDYERLEARFAEERQFFESRAEQHPFLKEVMAGKRTFAEKEVKLFADYQRDGLSCLEFSSFMDMVEDIAGIELNGDLRMLVDTAFLFQREPPEHYLRENWFKPIAEACAGLDRRIRRCYSLPLLRQPPEAFEELCSGMEPAELEHTRMKLFEQLGAEYTAFGNALGSLCEQHPFVQKIMDGKATFASMARSLNDRFGEMRPTFREQWGQRYLGEVAERCKPYLEELVSFTGAVDSLSGEEVKHEVLDFPTTVEFLLGGLIIKKKTWDMHAFINKEFERYTALAGKLDNRLCLHVAPRSVTETPEAFREAYAAAHPLEKEYVRNRLVKAVGAGAVRDMGEDEVLRFLGSLDK